GLVRTRAQEERPEGCLLRRPLPRLLRLGDRGRGRGADPIHPEDPQFLVADQGEHALLGPRAAIHAGERLPQPLTPAGGERTHESHKRRSSARATEPISEPSITSGTSCPGLRSWLERYSPRRGLEYTSTWRSTRLMIQYTGIRAWA